MWWRFLLPALAMAAALMVVFAGVMGDLKPLPELSAQAITIIGGTKQRHVPPLLAGTVGAAALAPIAAMAQQATAATGAPPTVISNPPRQWGHHAPPAIYPDPDIIVIDPSFTGLRIGNTGIHRMATAFVWAEGAAWSNEGQYFVFRDVSGNTQFRMLWDDRRVTPFRRPSNNSNGNSFDFQGRRLPTEDFNRRVVRWEHDGTKRGSELEAI